jgi:hypothetical protein
MSSLELALRASFWGRQGNLGAIRRKIERAGSDDAPLLAILSAASSAWLKRKGLNSPAAFCILFGGDSDVAG